MLYYLHAAVCRYSRRWVFSVGKIQRVLVADTASPVFFFFSISRSGLRFPPSLSFTRNKTPKKKKKK